MNTTLIINITTSVLVFTAGILIAFGIIMPTVDMSTRMIFGILFMAYGIYRFINVMSKIKLMKMQERSEQLRKETEDLIKNAGK